MRSVQTPVLQSREFHFTKRDSKTGYQHSRSFLEEGELVPERERGGSEGRGGRRAQCAERRRDEGEFDVVLTAERGVDIEGKTGGLEGEGEQVGLAQLVTESGGVGEEDGEKMAE